MQFPDDESCLKYLIKLRRGTEIACPKCGHSFKFDAADECPVYTCSYCDQIINPLLDTPFYNSSIPLQKWFYAIYLFTTSPGNNFVSEIEAQLGVSHNTASSMSQCIDDYMRKTRIEKPIPDIKCPGKCETCIG
jgi:transposase